MDWWEEDVAEVRKLNSYKSSISALANPIRHPTAAATASTLPVKQVLTIKASDNTLVPQRGKGKLPAPPPALQLQIRKDAAVTTKPSLSKPADYDSEGGSSDEEQMEEVTLSRHVGKLHFSAVAALQQEKADAAKPVRSVTALLRPAAPSWTIVPPSTLRKKDHKEEERRKRHLKQLSERTAALEFEAEGEEGKVAGSLEGAFAAAGLSASAAATVPSAAANAKPQKGEGKGSGKCASKTAPAAAAAAKPTPSAKQAGGGTGTVASAVASSTAAPLALSASALAEAPLGNLHCSSVDDEKEEEEDEEALAPLTAELLEDIAGPGYRGAGRGAKLAAGKHAGGPADAPALAAAAAAAAAAQAPAKESLLAAKPALHRVSQQMSSLFRRVSMGVSSHTLLHSLPPGHRQSQMPVAGGTVAALSMPLSQGEQLQSKQQVRQQEAAQLEKSNNGPLAAANVSLAAAAVSKPALLSTGKPLQLPSSIYVPLPGLVQKSSAASHGDKLLPVPTQASSGSIYIKSVAGAMPPSDVTMSAGGQGAADFGASGAAGDDTSDDGGAGKAMGLPVAGSLSAPQQTAAAAALPLPLASQAQAQGQTAAGSVRVMALPVSLRSSSAAPHPPATTSSTAAAAAAQTVSWTDAAVSASSTSSVSAELPVAVAEVSTTMAVKPSKRGAKAKVPVEREEPVKDSSPEPLALAVTAAAPIPTAGGAGALAGTLAPSLPLSAPATTPSSLLLLHSDASGSAPPLAQLAFECCLSSIVEFLPSSDLLHSAAQVSRSWSRVCSTVFSWRVAAEMTGGVVQLLESQATTAAGASSSEQRCRLHFPTSAPMAAVPSTGPSTSSAGSAKNSSRILGDSSSAANAAAPSAAGKKGKATAAAKKAEEGSAAVPSALGPLHAVASMPAVPTPTPMPAVPVFTSWASFLSAFPWGCFLAEGAYKSVYKVWSRAAGRLEAVSVMDLSSLYSSGGLPVAQAEIQAGCLLSELVRTGVCPNYLETYQVLLHCCSPKEDFSWHWGRALTEEEQEEETGEGAGEDDLHARKLAAACPQGKQCPYQGVTVPSSLLAAALPAAPSKCLPPALLAPAAEGGQGKAAGKGKRAATAGGNGKGGAAAAGAGAGAGISSSSGPSGSPSSEPSLYLYIRMELCEGGDLEEHLREVEPLAAAVDALTALQCQIEGSAAAAALPAVDAAGLTALEALMAALQDKKPSGMAAALEHPMSALANAVSQLSLSAAPAKSKGKGRKPGPAPSSAAAAASTTTSTSATALPALLTQLDREFASFALRSLLQMLFSLFAAQQKLSLRHGDIKLLNFLLKGQQQRQRKGEGKAQEEMAAADDALLEYWLGDSCYSLPLQGSSLSESPTTTLAAASALHAALPPTPLAAASASPADLHQALQRALQQRAFTVKLADYGTAETGEMPVPAPAVRSYHFTTLENSAPEMLLLGDSCAQGPSLDGWAMGLAALHLFSGAAPYEELLAEVRCPPALAAGLSMAWQLWRGEEKVKGAGGKGKGKGKAGAAAAAVAGAAAPSSTVPLLPNWTRHTCLPFKALCSAAGDEESQQILADSLYRFLVLTGWGDEPSEEAREEGSGVASASVAAFQSSQVWQLLKACLLPPLAREDMQGKAIAGAGAKAGAGSSAGAAVEGKRVRVPSKKAALLPAAAATAAAPLPVTSSQLPAELDSLLPAPVMLSIAEQFQADKAEFSVHRGQQQHLQRARRRLQAVPGAQQLVMGLLSLDPHKRLTMEQALQHPAFASLKDDGGAATAADGKRRHVFAAFSTTPIITTTVTSSPA